VGQTRSDRLVTLARIDDRESRAVGSRFFAGLEETAEVLGISVRTVHREWDLARACLFAEFGGTQLRPG
jgi:RNA polymerase sigma-70 factor, ECF subfamily